MSAKAKETDHEFKTRMAAEGRAIYVPGKTPDEIRAQQVAEEERRTKPVAITLELTEDTLSRLDTMLPDMCELVNDAAAVFAFLADGLTTESIDREYPAAWSVMRLSARALRMAELQELPDLDKLDAALRSAQRVQKKGAGA